MFSTSPLPGESAFVNEQSKLPVLAKLIGSLKSLLGRRGPNCRDDSIWEWVQLKAGTQGPCENSSAIIESHWEMQLLQISEHLGSHTGDHYLLSTAHLVPLHNHLSLGAKESDIIQPPCLLLIKLYTATSAHTSARSLTAMSTKVLDVSYGVWVKVLHIFLNLLCPGASQALFLVWCWYVPY